MTSQTSAIASATSVISMLPRIVPLFMWLSSVLSTRTPCGPADCAEVLCMGLADDGMHTLHLEDDHLALKCICNSITRGGGWNVFQVREFGTVSFSRSWEEYKEGFGNDREYWLGNEYVHRMTRGREMMLLVEMEDRYGDRMYAQYDGFSIGDEESGYKLMLGSYLNDYSTAGDLLRYGTRVACAKLMQLLKYTMGTKAKTGLHRD